MCACGRLPSLLNLMNTQEGGSQPCSRTMPSTFLLAPVDTFDWLILEHSLILYHGYLRAVHNQQCMLTKRCIVWKMIYKKLYYLGCFNLGESECNFGHDLYLKARMKSMGLSYLISSDTFYHGPEQLYWVWVRKFSRAGIRRKYIIQKRKQNTES